MRFIVLSLCCGSLFIAWGQRPEVDEGGIVNTASYQASGLSGAPLGPGSLGSVYGRYLAAGQDTATVYPLPKRLAGAEVYVDGIPASILFASPGQINFQVPAALIGTNGRGTVPAEIVVVTSEGPSRPRYIRLGATGYGLFVSRPGCAAPVLAMGEDGHLITPESSAHPAETITMFGTGFGLSFFLPEDGKPSPGGLDMIRNFYRYTLTYPKAWMPRPSRRRLWR